MFENLCLGLPIKIVPALLHLLNLIETEPKIRLQLPLPEKILLLKHWLVRVLQHAPVSVVQRFCFEAIVVVFPEGLDDLRICVVIRDEEPIDVFFGPQERVTDPFNRLVVQQ